MPSTEHFGKQRNKKSKNNNPLQVLGCLRRRFRNVGCHRSCLDAASNNNNNMPTALRIAPSVQRSKNLLSQQCQEPLSPPPILLLRIVDWRRRHRDKWVHCGGDESSANEEDNVERNGLSSD